MSKCVADHCVSDTRNFPRSGVLVWDLRAGKS
jgi:hypothetical protein